MTDPQQPLYPPPQSDAVSPGHEPSSTSSPPPSAARREHDELAPPAPSAPSAARTDPSTTGLPAAPSAADIDATLKYYTALRNRFAEQVRTIEQMLGYIGDSDELAVRIAKLEQFTGVNRKG